ncbi:MAG: PadR family transcriptional regulator [Alphaproteobacteria bacterium]|nr:MAG: PadR family transcriptional regulator [Alphaproteobacteria bacterium]
MTNESDLLRGNTPTLILAVLMDGPQHGYAIAQEINRQTDSSLKFKQGTLYAMLHKLESDELVLGEWQHVEGERPRLVYAITEAGREALAERVATWNRFARAMDRMIGGIQIPTGEQHEQPA